MTRRVLAACVLIALGWAVSALAQGDDPAFVTVAGDAAGAQLQVHPRPGGLCARIVPRELDADTCADLPRIDLFTPFVLDIASTDRPSGPSAVGGAVRSGVARVEYVVADGRRFAADTVAAPQLGGRLARALRYFLIELPAGADPVTRRMFDPAGRLVDEQDGVFVGGSGAEPPPSKGPALLARGRSNGARWSLYATVRSTLAPVRGDVGRRVANVCTAKSRSSVGSAGCAVAAEATFGIGIDDGCPGRAASLLHGIAGPGARVEVRLGDGRVHRARMLALPAGYARAGARAWVFAVPSDAAIRDVRVRGSDGRVRQRLELDQSPPRMTCDSIGIATLELGGSAAAPPFTTPPVVLAPGGGPPLTVRDAGAELCVAVGRTADERLCEAPRPWVIAPLVVKSRDGRVAGGAVDPAIAAVEVIASDGSRRRVATDPGQAYTGRYAGLMRFFSVAAPPGKRLESYALLDARGRHLFGLPLALEFAPAGPQRTVLTEHARGGRFDLVQLRFPIPFLETRLDCLSVVRHRHRTRDVFGCVGIAERGHHLATDEASGVVRCDLRAAIVVGGAPRAAASVRMRLDDGTARPGRLFESGLGRGFLAVPPAGRGLRRIEVLDGLGRALRTFRARVPPAARQCGYRFELSSIVVSRARPARVWPAAPPRVWQPYASYRSVRLTPVSWRRQSRSGASPSASAPRWP